MSPSSTNCKASADLLLEQLEREGLRRGYRFLPQAFVERINATDGDAARSDLLRELVLHLIDRFGEIRTRPLRAKLPASVEREYDVEFARMRKHYADAANAPSLGNDLYLKDLGLATLKLLPTGISLVDLRQGIPRSTLLKAARESAWHGLRTATFVLLAHRGFAPTFETHMMLTRREEFTFEGRRHSFRVIADLLELNPEYLGMFGSSWYYDPQLAQVSPRLAFARADMEQHGAWFAHVGTDENTIKSATGSSATRKSLYESGAYLPRSYMVIWPRRAMLAFRTRYPEGGQRAKVS